VTRVIQLGGHTVADHAETAITLTDALDDGERDVIIDGCAPIMRRRR
jgi:hypothetical protein